MQSRRFGVELEFGWPNGYEAGKAAVRAAIKDGVVSGNWARDGAFTQDGTCIEVRSPILAGKEGFAELKGMMNYLEENGGYCTSNDGMHVHHDAPEYVENIDLVKRLVLSWIENRAIIQEFVAARRHHSMCCPTWQTERLERLLGAESAGKGGFKDDAGAVGFSRYDLNISSLARHGTIELRLHEGTLDFNRAEAWIRFGQAMLNRIPKLPEPLKKTADIEELMEQVKVTKRARAELRARVQTQQEEIRKVAGAVVFNP